jgi:hypothetical protein
MVDVDTFLTALYVMVDDFYNSRSPKQQRPGPDASLSTSELITLASSPDGPDSPARGTSTAMPVDTSERPSPPCQIHTVAVFVNGHRFYTLRRTLPSFLHAVTATRKWRGVAAG